MLWREFCPEKLSGDGLGWEEDSILFISLEWIKLDRKQTLPLLSPSYKEFCSKREKISFGTWKITFWNVKNFLHGDSFWQWFLFWDHGHYKKQDLYTFKWDQSYQANRSCPGLWLWLKQTCAFVGAHHLHWALVPLPISPPLLSWLSWHALAIPKSSVYFFSNLLASILGHCGWGMEGGCCWF